MKRVTKEVRIGLATILSGVILFFGINFLKGVNLVKPANYYYVDFKNVQGLTLSSPINIDGFKVGLVRSISYNYNKPGNIVVEISLDKQLTLPKDSKAELEIDLLGTASINLTLNKYVSENYHPGDTIIGIQKRGLMPQVENEIVPQIAILLPKIDSILTGINKLVNSSQLENSIKNIELTTNELKRSSVYLSSLLKSDIPQLTSDMKGVTKNLNGFSSQLNDINLTRIASGIDTTIHNLQTLTEKINSQDNTFGLLLNSKGLYNNINKTVISADSLLIDLKKHPKRYVHFSVF